MRRAPFDGWAKRDGLERLIPNLAGATQLGVAGAAWNWSAYVQMTAGDANGYIPHALHWGFAVANPTATGALSVVVEVEIATGAAGSEITYARVSQVLAWSVTVLGASPLLGSSRTLPLDGAVILAGTRIAARIRASQAATLIIIRSGLYLEGHQSAAPVAYPAYSLQAHLSGVHRPQTLATPTGSTLLITPTAFPNYGSWVTVIDPAPKDLLVWGCAFQGSSSIAFAGQQLQLGTGPSGSEVARAVIGLPNSGQITINCGHSLLRRPLLVKKGERLAARLAGGGGATGFQFFWEEV